MNPDAKGEPSVVALLGSLASETGSLVRQEVHLASVEITLKVKAAVGKVGMIGLGGALTHAGLLTLIAATIFALGPSVPMWMSALVIGFGAFGIGYALIHRGLKVLRELDVVPRQTLKTLEQDKVWVKEQLR